MRVFFASLLLLAPSLLAAGPSPMLVTLGPWAMCESPLASSFGLCAGFVPGSEKYLLLIPKADAAVAYRFHVLGFLQNGRPTAVSGLVERAPATINETSVVIDAGGILADGYHVVVESLFASPIGAQQ